MIPVFNNRPAVLDALVEELAAELDRLEVSSEVVFVDDGSGEQTRRALAALVRSNARVRVVELVTNFGQHPAFTAGFERARGRFIVTMDADGQADPRDLPKLLGPLREGYDMVSGVRQHRQDPAFRQVSSRLVTWLVARLTPVRLRDVGCPFNAFTAEVATDLSGFGELRRFLKPLAVHVARRVTEVEVTHRPRPAAEPQSSYSARRLVRLFMDLFVNSLGDVFAWTFFAGLGFAVLCALAAVALGGAALAGRLTYVWAVVAASLAACGALAGLLGLIGDYIQRIYRQSSGRPFYLIRRVLEHDDPEPAVPDAG